MEFNLPQNKSSVIKVIGVGGGGSNAVNHMENIGVEGVDFIICNTDRQALENSPVVNKIQLGVTTTEGLGAGADPEIGEKAALESLPQIIEVLENNTKMCFITAGMVGGTGTGAAPVIAKAAKDMGILTIGIVTFPFEFEGEGRTIQAESGVAAMRQSVDSLIIINNNKLQHIYGVLRYRAAFAKADEILANAAKGIAEIITKHYSTNIDLHDVKTVLKNSGTALFGTGQGDGADRALLAAEAALDSPLLDDNKITGARNILLLIASGEGDDEVTLDEIGIINSHVQRMAGNHANIIMGIGNHPDFTGIRVTVIATGFPKGDVSSRSGQEKRKVYSLDDDTSNDAPTGLGKRDDEDGDEDPMNQPLAHWHSESIEQNATHHASPTIARSEVREDPEEEVEEERVVVWSLSDEDTVSTTLELEVDETATSTTGSVHTMSWDNEGEQEFTLDDVEGEGIALNFSEPSTEDTTAEVPYDAFSQSIDSIQNIDNHFAETQKSMRSTGAVEVDVARAPLASQHPTANDPGTVDPDLHFEVRRVAPQKAPEVPKNVDPMLLPLEELEKQNLTQLAEDRRIKLNAMNKRYAANQNARMDIDKIPAFKRKGLDIHTGKRSEQTPQQMRIDEKGDFRTNNSFLHDNVD